MIRSPFKVQKHKRFDFSPRYYDQRKENIEQSRKFYAGEHQQPHQLDFTGTFQQMKKRKGIFSDRLPLMVLVLLIVCVMAYVRQGSEIYLYLSAVCFPAYILLRLKSKSATHRKPLNYYEQNQEEETR